jgi:hypothetical protein
VSADDLRLIGASCLEAGETAVEALQREAVEEIGCSIRLRSADRTLRIGPRGASVVDEVWLDGYRPAIIWEGEGPDMRPGMQVAVFHGDAEGDPQPGDLPAIVIADPATIIDIGDHPTTVADLATSGAQLRTRIDLPPRGRLKLVGTLDILRRLHGTPHSFT